MDYIFFVSSDFCNKLYISTYAWYDFKNNKFKLKLIP